MNNTVESSTVEPAPATLTWRQKAAALAAERYEVALKRILDVCGERLHKAIIVGSRLKNRRDVLAYAALDDGQMLDILGLVESGWSVSKARHFKAEKIWTTHRFIDVINRAAANGGRYEQIVVDEETGSHWHMVVTRHFVAPVTSRSR